MRTTTTYGSHDEELRHIGDLVIVRRAIAARGASEAELAECDAVIDAARRRLAAEAKVGAARFATAA